MVYIFRFKNLSTLLLLYSYWNHPLNLNPVIVDTNKQIKTLLISNPEINVFTEGNLLFGVPVTFQNIYLKIDSLPSRELMFSLHLIMS